MKQLTLILIFMLSILCTSCIYVDEECPGYMRFSFLYEGSSVEYDEQIGNDIHLRIYQDNILYQSGIIPYESIKEGKEYKIRKEIKGEIDIVAWAVPREAGNVDEIPTLTDDKTLSAEMIEMPSSTKSVATHESMGYLYLGTFTHKENDILSDTEYPVDMNPCTAQFTSTLYNIPELYSGEEEMQKLWLIIHGTKSRMDTHFNPIGQDAVVRAGFTQWEEKGAITTSTHGLLPSDENQYLSVDIYKEHSYRGTIQTDIQAKPGDKIHLDIYRSTVVIHVNGWRIFDTNVDWI